MTLQLTDNLWSLKYDEILDANIEKYLIGTFTNPFVIVSVKSDDALPEWRQAGTIGQAVDFDDNIAHGEVKQLVLNTFLLLQFPLLTGNNYQLYYFPLIRLVRAKVKIWEYQGETIDVSINQLINALSLIPFSNLDLSANTEISRIESKLDKLLTCCDCKDSPTKEPGKLYLAYYHNLL